MCKEFEMIIKTKKEQKIREEDIFKNIKKILEKTSEIYLDSALFSMVLDSIEGNRNIFKVKKEIRKVSSPQLKFKII